MVHLTHLNLLVEILLKTYFFHSRCILIFTDSNIESRLEIPIVYLKVGKTLNSHLIFQHYGCQNVIIHHENASELFVQFEALIRLKNERYNSRKYIISGEDALEIFNKNELQYVCDILVIVPEVFDNSTEKYDLMTHNYGDQNQSTKANFLDSWFPQNSSFLFGTNLFPDKLYNQNGRVLKIGTFHYEPYSIVENDNKSIHGTETSFIFEFVKKHNLTPSFTIITGGDLWGDIYENWTGTGILGSILNDEVDIGYGAIYTWEEYYKFLDYSKPLTRTGVTALVPAPELAAGWLTPLRSFSNQMWMGVLLVFAFDTIILTYLFYKNRDRHFFEDSVTTLMKLYLLQSLTIPLKGKVMKYFIALNMINVLLLSSSYSSGLSSVMTVPRYKKAIKTVDDLAERGLQWGAPTDAWLISLRQVTEENYKIIKNNFVVKTEEDLRALSRLHNFGFALERLPYGHFAVAPYVKRDVISNYRIMQQDIYWEQCIFVVRKNSVFLPLLDSLLLRVFEAGLSAFWESEVVAQYMDMSVQRGIMYHFQKPIIVQLKWVHVEGAFGVLLIGYIISTLTFLLEILIKRRFQS